MRALITGGTGFIGSRLALRCLARGDEVRVLGLENTPAETENRRHLEEMGVEVFAQSITEAGLLPEILAGSDVVFHLAAAQHEMDVPDQHFWDVNVQGTVNMLEASVEVGVRRFIHGSTIGVYGVPQGRIDEESIPQPDNIYGVTKLAGEARVLAFGDRLSVLVIRIPEVYGPADRRLVKLFRPVARGKFVIIGKGENLHHLIFVEDLVDAFLAAADHEAVKGQALLLAGPKPITTEEMVRAVARAVDRPPPRIHLPLLPFSLLATAMELGLRPLGIQPPLHRRRLDFFRKSFELSADKANRLLGFEPRTSFEEGARKTALWYREHEIL
jgi:nucleoside-diphosphate-sugar epimerase